MDPTGPTAGRILLLCKAMVSIQLWFGGVVVFTSLAPPIMAFSQGASPASCKEMVPGHIRAHPLDPEHSYVTVQTSASSYLPGQLVTVTVRSSRDFMGFLLQARSLGGVKRRRYGRGAGIRSRKLGPLMAGGSWILTPPGTHTLHCLSEGDTITHSDKQLKRNLSFVWRAPDAPMGDVRFIITVVQSYFIYWAGVESAVVHDGSRRVWSSDENTAVDGGSTVSTVQEERVTAPPRVNNTSEEEQNWTQTLKPTNSGSQTLNSLKTQAEVNERALGSDNSVTNHMSKTNTLTLGGTHMTPDSLSVVSKGTTHDHEFPLNTSIPLMSSILSADQRKMDPTTHPFSLSKPPLPFFSQKGKGTQRDDPRTESQKPKVKTKSETKTPGTSTAPPSTSQAFQVSFQNDTSWITSPSKTPTTSTKTRTTSSMTQTTSPNTETTSLKTQTTPPKTQTTSSTTQTTSLSTQTTSSTTQTTSLSTQTTSPKTQTTSPKIQTTSLKTQTTSPNTQTTSLSTQTTSPKTQTTSLKTQTTSPNTQTTSSTTQITSPKTQTTSLKTQTTSLKTPTTPPKIQTTSPNTRTTTPQIQTTSPKNQTTSPTTQTTSSTTQTTSPTTQTTSLKTPTTPPKTQTTSLKTQITSPKTPTTSPKTQITSLKTQITSLKTQTTSPKTQTTSPKTQITSLKTQTTSIKTQVTSLKTQTSSPKTQTTSLKTQTTSPKTQTTSLKTQITSPKTQTTSPMTQTTSLKTQTTSLKTQTTSLKTQTTSPKTAFPSKSSTFGPFQVPPITQAFPSPGSSPPGPKNIKLTVLPENAMSPSVVFSRSLSLNSFHQSLSETRSQTSAVKAQTVFLSQTSSTAPSLTFQTQTSHISLLLKMFTPKTQTKSILPSKSPPLQSFRVTPFTQTNPLPGTSPSGPKGTPKQTISPQTSIYLSSPSQRQSSVSFHQVQTVPTQPGLLQIDQSQSEVPEETVRTSPQPQSQTLFQTGQTLSPRPVKPQIFTLKKDLKSVTVSPVFVFTPSSFSSSLHFLDGSSGLRPSDASPLHSTFRPTIPVPSSSSSEKQPRTIPVSRSHLPSAQRSSTTNQPSSLTSSTFPLNTSNYPSNSSFSSAPASTSTVFNSSKCFTSSNFSPSSTSAASQRFFSLSSSPPTPTSFAYSPTLPPPSVSSTPTQSSFISLATPHPVSSSSHFLQTSFMTPSKKTNPEPNLSSVVHPNPKPFPNHKLDHGQESKSNVPNTDTKPKRPSNPSNTPDREGKYPDINPRHSSWELGMLLGCSAGLGMVLVVGVRYVYRQACGRRTQVTLNDREREYGRGLIQVQECGDLVRVRKIRENSFVLLTEYDVLAPPGN